MRWRSRFYTALNTSHPHAAHPQIRTILGREGLRGMYAGYGAFMLRDLPFDAIEFVAYEQIKKAYGASVGRELNPGETSLIGAFAGGFTGACAWRSVRAWVTEARGEWEGRRLQVDIMW